MNIIFAKHDGCHDEYCFKVPDNLATHISKGDILLVNTRRGIDIATASTNIVSGDGAVDVAIKNGAYLPLKTVISFANAKMIDCITRKNYNEIISKIWSNMPRIDENLPF